MDFLTFNLFTITPEKTGIEDILKKYVDDGFLESFMPGEPVFILKNGTKTSQARKKDIDWKAMEKDVWSRVRQEASSWRKENDEMFLETRYKVHKRPIAFIGKDGKWHDEEEDGLESQTHDEEDYNYIWEKTFSEASAEDVFSHWDIRI